MFWGQAVASFLAWIVYGVYRARTSALVRADVVHRPRSARALLALGGLIGAVVSLAVALALVYRFEGIVPGVMKMWAWILITAEGFLFVTLQTYAMAALASLAGEAAVTHRDAAASTPQAPD